MSVGEWINLWYIQAMEDDSVPKRNELSRYEKTYRNLKCMLLSERSLSEKTTYDSNSRASEKAKPQRQ